MSEYLFKSRVLKMGEYKIPQEGAEVVADWKAEVEGILQEIDKVDLEAANLAQLLGSEKENQYVSERGNSLAKKAEEMLAEGEWDRENKIMLAIGLWLMSKKGKWSDFKEMGKALVGGEHSLSEAVNTDNVSNCMESSTAAKLLAGEFGIEGDIITLGTDIKPAKINLEAGYGHHVFQNNTGSIVDIYWARKQCGYFKDIVDMIEKGKDAEPGSCHPIWKKFIKN